MPIRNQQGLVKFSVAAEGDFRVQQGLAKFAVETEGNLRIQQGVVKFAVRTFPIVRIAKFVPPMDITISQAPYVKTSAATR